MLRPYQLELKQAIFAAWRAGYRRPLAQSPTGSGKTVLAASIALELLMAGYRVLYLVPSIEILNQTRIKLQGRQLRVSTYDQARKQIHGRRCVLGTTQTFARRGDPIPGWTPDYIFVDEAHLMLDHLTRAVTRYPNARVLSLTATPERFDGKPLTTIADIILPGPPIHALIERGMLCPLRQIKLLVPPKIPLTPEQVVDQWEYHAKGRKTMAFCRSKNVSKAVAAEFRQRGYSALHVDESAAKSVRSNALESLRDGSLTVLCNVGLFAQGVDIEEIDCVLLERETGSVSRYLQQIGRGMRRAPGKKFCIILDLAVKGTGNHWRFGEPWLDRQWSLTERNIARKTRATQRKA